MHAKVRKTFRFRIIDIMMRAASKLSSKGGDHTLLAIHICGFIDAEQKEKEIVTVSVVDTTNIPTSLVRLLCSEVAQTAMASSNGPVGMMLRFNRASVLQSHDGSGAVH